MVTAAAAAQPILELTGIGKEFGAIRALHGVDMQVFPGQVVGLMGDNGAGKSTLVKIIAGNFPPTHGEIRFEGRAVHFRRPIDALLDHELGAGHLGDILLRVCGAAGEHSCHAVAAASGSSSVAPRCGGGWPAARCRRPTGIRRPRATARAWGPAPPAGS